MNISRDAYESALAELEEIRHEKREKVNWDDKLYQLVTEAMKDTRSRKADRITWDDLAALLVRRGWWGGSANALKQAYARERKRRAA